MRFKTVVAAALAALPAVARAQSGDTLSLQGRNALTLGLGLSGTSSSRVTIDGATSHTDGQMASIGFSHWLRPTVAFEVTAAVLGAETSTSGGHARNNTLTPLLFGFSVSPRSFAVSRALRPYLSAAVGPYVHTTNDVGGGATSNEVESSAGARFGAGANWFFARHFLAGLEADYHAVHKFDHPDALTKDPSGFGLALKFGVVWGGP